MRSARYYLIACGTKEYPHLGDYEALESVEDDIERVVNALSKCGYERVLQSSLNLNPSRDALILNFTEWLQSEDRADTDRVIFYYSGHGHSIEGDRHYLLLQDTKETMLAQTSLPTEELIRPLNNEGIKVNQILYIIDTCYAGQGVAEINRFASEVLDRHQAVYASDRKSVHFIAASRFKQPATSGIFSELFQSELEQFLEDDKKSTELRFIQPSLLVDKINGALDETQRSRQRVVHSKNLCEKGVYFFPVYPKSLVRWEANRDNLISRLMEITSAHKEDALLFMNSFLLMSSPKSDLIFEQAATLEKLRYLGSLPVLDGICQLVALSEWLRQKFLNRNYRKANAKEIAKQIGIWQRGILLHREDVDFDLVEEKVKDKLEAFRDIISEQQPRLQIEIEPEIDTANNTGKKTGHLNLYVNLWVRNKSVPLARLLQNRLDYYSTNSQKNNHADRLIDCLEENKMLSSIVDRVHLILSPEKLKSLMLEIEFILPFEYFEIPLDKMKCSYTPKFSRVLGTEYPLFINSYERYFDEEYFRSKEDVYLKKERLWKDEKHELVICYNDDVCANGGEIDIDAFERHDIFIGSQPSESTLDLIEATFPIAVWSRDSSINLREELDITRWQDWPGQIQALRKHKKSANITLFWDDLYPKPSERSRPLNTSVVE
ncbi:MAG: caspase family protein [Leptolyngbya sp. SIO1D8]|nr:caspase family protein [Leptolyngbya sp. SIO1D8]